jgi:hypothetical protein
MPVGQDWVSRPSYKSRKNKAAPAKLIIIHAKDFSEVIWRALALIVPRGTLYALSVAGWTPTLM